MIDSFLIELDMPFEELGENMWRVDNENDNVPNILVTYADPMVLFHLKVMDVPSTGREALFRRLLELNADGVAYGAYALANDSVVLIDSLRAESMDLNEFRASIESLSLAVSQHYAELSSYLERKEV